MTTNTIGVLAHESIRNAKQTLHGERIVHRNGKTIKAIVERNAYDFQSAAYVEVLTEIGFQFLASLDISETEVSAFSYGSRAGQWEAAMGRDLDHLILIGVAVLS